MVAPPNMIIASLDFSNIDNPMEVAMPNTGHGSMTTSEPQRARSEKTTEEVLLGVTTGGRALTAYGLSSFAKSTPLPFSF